MDHFTLFTIVGIISAILLSAVIVLIHYRRRKQALSSTPLSPPQDDKPEEKQLTSSTTQLSPSSKETPLQKEEEIPSEGDDHPIKYEIIVGMEHPGVLAGKEKIQETVSGKLGGELYSSPAFAESGGDTNSLAPCIRRFALTEQSDFEPLREALMTIPGVIEVKKDGDAWDRTAYEKEVEESEQQRIAEGKEKRAKESLEERKHKLAELQKLEEETEKSDEENYGPPTSASQINHQKFQEFISSIGRCEVEARMAYGDLMAGGFLGYEREITELTSGKDAVPFFEEALNTKLQLPFQGKSSFPEIPFSVEYRQNNGRKYTHLEASGGRATLIMANYDLYVREL